MSDTPATSVSVTDLTPEDQVRANTYSLLAAVLAKSPDQAMLDLLSAIDVAEEEQDTAMAAAWKTLSLAAQRATVEAVDDEYHELFIGVGRGELLPYGSWYLTGYLMERPLAQLRADLAQLGLQRQEDVHEPEDHAAALCETMGLLIVNGNEISPHEQRRFFGEHIHSWMGRFFQDLQTANAAKFYSAVGGLGEQFLEIDKRYLDMLPH